jgi:hypothetical protein
MIIKSKFNTKSLTDNKILLLYLSVLSFIIQYLHFSSFGLYEDDYWSIAAGYTTTLHQLLSKVLDCFIYWPTGRPLNHALPACLGYLGHQLGGINALYIIASLWLGLNAWLIYTIVRTWLDKPAAFLAALVYISFPADTTRQLLVHVSHVQGAMTFMLIGWMLWLKETRTRWIAYLIASLALLSYETAFIAFVAAPLFGKRNSKISELKIWLEHILGCGTILGIVGLIRIHLADPRTISVLGSPKEAVLKAITSCILGPITIIHAYIVALTTGWKSITLLSLCACFLILILLYLIKRFENSSSATQPCFRKRIISASLITLALSYSLTLVNYPPTQLAGRLTSTHVAAALPWSIIIGIIYYLSSRQSIYLKKILFFLYALALFPLIGYSFSIQASYSEAWKLQKEFWQQILNLTPDISDNTSIIVAGTPSLASEPRFINSNAWADYYACQLLFDSDSRIKNSRSISFGHLGVVPELWDFTISKGKIQSWKPKYWTDTSKPSQLLPPKYQLLSSVNLILIYSDHGKLSRVSALQLNIPDNTGHTINYTLESYQLIPLVSHSIEPSSRLFKELWSRTDK